MTQDEIIEMARQAGIYHAQDSEYHWDGLTDQKIIERTPDSAKDIAWRNRRTFEILQPFAKLVAEKAIKEALAQPEQIQPSAYSNTHQPERHKLQAKGEHPAPCARHCEANAFKIVIKNLKAQLAQPEQEPVAHCKVRPLRGDESFPKVEIDWVNQPIPGPLYTTPPQRKPLTDEEIYKIANDLFYGNGPCDTLAMCRAIEAAHGIKENT